MPACSHKGETRIPIVKASTAVHHGYGDRSGRTLPGIRTRDASTIHTPTSAISESAPASHAHANISPDTTVARNDCRRIAAVLVGPQWPRRYRARMTMKRLITSTDHGAVAPVRKFATINADHTP